MSKWIEADLSALNANYLVAHNFVGPARSVNDARD
jgi:hypothetical protein